MAAEPFEIRILSSAVMGPQPERDPMLGGHVRVTIHGVVVADDDGFGLERSALGLLRTIDQDHDATSDLRAFHVPGLGFEATYSGPATRAGFPTLLIHDCGFPTAACSNFYVDWTVRHERGGVRIADVQRFAERRDLRFPEAAGWMSLEEYRTPIAHFARSVRDAYFADGDKVIDDPDERQDYDKFWAEFSELLAAHGQ